MINIKTICHLSMEVDLSKCLSLNPKIVSDMADQSGETMEEEEMARQSQEPEQRSRAVVENIQPLPETRDLVRAENTQMLQGINLRYKGINCD